VDTACPEQTPGLPLATGKILLQLLIVITLSGKDMHVQLTSHGPASIGHVMQAGVSSS
jgi:hypothetical protein